MRCLNQFFENDYVRGIFEACRASAAVQGIMVEIHSQWLAAWRIGERYDPNHPDKGLDQHLQALGSGQVELGPRPAEFKPSTAQPWFPARPLAETDLLWRPPFWTLLDPKSTYSRWPVLMRICLYPRGGADRGQAPFFRGEGFAIRYEVRPVARLYASPKDQHRPVLGGVSVGVNSTEAGTMGGILKGSSGKYYGVTCAHVVGQARDVDQPAQIDNAGGVIGAVVESQLPPAYPSYAKKIAANQQWYASKVDVALVEIQGATTAKLEVLKMGRITALVSLADIEQDEEMQLTGRSSDWQKVQRACRSPYYNVTNKITGDEYCYENPLVFREPSGAAAAQPGDSGSWLCKEVGAAYHWAAMLVAGDRQLGIAVGADEIKAWWESLPGGYTLSVC